MRSLRATMKSSPRSPQLEKAHAQQQRPNAAKKKKKKVRGEGFQDLDLGEIQELINITPEELTEDSLMEMSASEQVQRKEM